MKARQLLLLLLGIAALAACGRSSDRFSIEEYPGANPWTHLQANNDPADFQFAVVADRNGGMRPGVFASAVEKLNTLQPEFVLCVGDLIGGYTEEIERLDRQWKEFEDEVARLEMPFFYVPGNHDITNPIQLEQWNERFGRPYYHMVYRNVLFLILDTEDPPRGDEFDGLSDRQLAYFRRVLSQNRKVRWTLVFLHKPMWHRESAARWEEFEALLGEREYTVIAGHDHRYQRESRNGHDYFTLATTGGSSTLEGPESGRVDHLLWITMTEDGPRIANLLLDGILDTDLR